MSIRKRLVVVFSLLLMILLGMSPTKEVIAKERTTVDISKGSVVIKKSGDYNLIGNTSKYKIIVKKGAKVNLWISDLSIEKSDNEMDEPINVESGATLNLIVSGKNSITNYIGGDAITVAKGGNLSISKDSTGTLTCVGSMFGSGIGGEGDTVINGGTLIATGGVYGAGIGSSRNPIGTLTVNGGKVVARSGITPVEIGTDYEDPASSSFKVPNVYDVCVGKFVITGGDIHLATTTKEPVNTKGEKLERILFNCEKGEVKSITVNGKAYGANSIVSKGYLSLWINKEDFKTVVTSIKNNQKIEEKELKVIVTFKNGKITTQNAPYGSGIYTDDYGYDLTLDISNSSIEFLPEGFIYDNHVYKSQSRNWHKIIGSTDCNQIYMNKGDYYLDFSNVTVNDNKNNHDFLILGSQAKVTMNFTGKNTFTTIQDNHAITLGNQAMITFTGDRDKGTLTFNNTNGYGSIFTVNGTINQYGGTIIAKAKGDGIGVVLGDTGSFHLYGGSFNGSSEGTHSIYGLNGINVSVYGGELIADTIGYHEEGNEVLSEHSTFQSFGGLTKISNRMIFGNIEVYGGKIEAHLLGSGSGTEYIQLSGEVYIDQFLTRYSDYDSYYIIIDNKVNPISFLREHELKGGIFEETHNVTVEELEKISFGRS